MHKGRCDHQADGQPETRPVRHVVEQLALGGRSPAFRSPSVEEIEELPQEDQTQRIGRRPTGQDHPAAGQPADQVHQAQDVGVPVVGNEFEGQ